MCEPLAQASEAQRTSANRDESSPVSGGVTVEYETKDGVRDPWPDGRHPDDVKPER